MTQSQQRAAIVAEARSWLGTPYHHQADIKGAGVDCGMLIVRVFVDAGLVPPFDPRPYPVDWHLHRSEERYLGFIGVHLKPVATPLPGDVVVFKYGRCFSHGGIVADWPDIIHAFRPARMVELHDVTNGPMAKHDRQFFSLWVA